MDEIWPVKYVAAPPVAREHDPPHRSANYCTGRVKYRQAAAMFPCLGAWVTTTLAHVKSLTIHVSNPLGLLGKKKSRGSIGVGP